MKFKLAAVLIMVFASSVFSQRFFLSAGSGLSVPVAESEFTDAYNLGFNIHGSVTVPLNVNVMVRGDVQYNNFPFDESNPNLGGSFKVTTIKADFILGGFAPRNVSPYGFAGAGLYLLSASVTQNNITVSSSETEFGLGLGAGINFSVSSNTSLYIETQYNFIFSDGAAKGYLPLKFGLMFGM